MAIYQRNGSSIWWVEFEFRGQRIRKSTGTASQKKAKDYESRLRHELHERVVMGNGSATPMTIGEAVERYISTHLRLRKKREKSKKADAFLLDALIERIGGENVMLDSLDTKAISAFKTELIQKGLAPASVNKYLAALKAILRKANREWGTLAVVPNITLLPLNNNRLRWLTDDEERCLLSECEQTPHLKNLVTFLLDTGTRLSEATHLTWGNVDLTRKPRGIVRFMETKSGKPRSVPLASRTHEMLRKLWEVRPEGQARVFTGASAGLRSPQDQAAGQAVS